jgi:hypothetical protein
MEVMRIFVCMKTLWLLDVTDIADGAIILSNAVMFELSQNAAIFEQKVVSERSFGFEKKGAFSTKIRA